MMRATQAQVLSHANHCYVIYERLAIAQSVKACLIHCRHLWMRKRLQSQPGQRENPRRKGCRLLQ